MRASSSFAPATPSLLYAAFPQSVLGLFGRYLITSVGSVTQSSLISVLMSAYEVLLRATAPWRERQLAKLLHCNARYKYVHPPYEGPLRGETGWGEGLDGTP